MNRNVQAGIFYLAAAVVVGYTWWVGAWAGLFEAVTGQVAAGGSQAHPRAQAVS